MQISAMESCRSLLSSVWKVIGEKYERVYSQSEVSAISETENDIAVGVFMLTAFVSCAFSYRRLSPLHPKFFVYSASLQMALQMCIVKHTVETLSQCCSSRTAVVANYLMVVVLLALVAIYTITIEYVKAGLKEERILAGVEYDSGDETSCDVDCDVTDEGNVEPRTCSRCEHGRVDRTCRIDLCLHSNTTGYLSDPKFKPHSH